MMRPIGDLKGDLICAALLLAVWAGSTAAQQPPDPRLTQQSLVAMQAMLTLREAQIKVLVEDHDKLVAELKVLCGEPCKDK